MQKKIRFAHLADLHLGAWREKNLTKLNFKAFQEAINKILTENIDFCIFAGDIFNNAMPPIEIVNEFAKELTKLKQKNIPIYIISGSHDYSPSGKSYLELLETTNMLKDVGKWQQTGNNTITLKFTQDKKTNTQLTGILGKKNGLDKNIYKKITNPSLKPNNFNIFLFHTALNDLTPKHIKTKSETTSNHLPKGFDYYAGGHIHTNTNTNNSKPSQNTTKNNNTKNKKTIAYSGALFPNNFSELKTEKPTFNICEFDFQTRQTKIKKHTLHIYEKEYIKIEIQNKNPIEAKNQITEETDKLDIKNKILLLEIQGTIDGKIKNIEINKIISKLYEKGAYHILKNTYKLKSTLLQNIEINENENIKEIENKIIEENLNQSQNFQNEFQTIKNLLKLELSKLEGEKNTQYEERVCSLIEQNLYTNK